MPKLQLIPVGEATASVGSAWWPSTCARCGARRASSSCGCTQTAAQNSKKSITAVKLRFDGGGKKWDEWAVLGVGRVAKPLDGLKGSTSTSALGPPPGEKKKRGRPPKSSKAPMGLDGEGSGLDGGGGPSSWNGEGLTGTTLTTMAGGGQGAHASRRLVHRRAGRGPRSPSGHAAARTAAATTRCSRRGGSAKAKVSAKRAAMAGAKRGRGEYDAYGGLYGAGVYGGGLYGGSVYGDENGGLYGGGLLYEREYDDDPYAVVTNATASGRPGPAAKGRGAAEQARPQAKGMHTTTRAAGSFTSASTTTTTWGRWDRWVLTQPPPLVQPKRARPAA